MHRYSLRPRRIIIAIVAIASMLAFGPFTPASAQEVPPANPIDLPCVTNVSAQVLNATPVGDGSQSLVLVRVILGPDGTIGNHTHPGTLAVTIESGSFGLTLAEAGEMTISRAGVAESESMPAGQQHTLAPGDGFIETGMIHSAANLSDGETTVLIAGLITTGEPLTACVDAAATAP